MRVCSHNRLPFVQRLTAFYQVLHILSRKLLCCMRAPCQTRTENEDRVLTHAVTHEQTGRKQWNGECLRVIESRVENPRRFPPYTLDPK